MMCKSVSYSSTSGVEGDAGSVEAYRCFLYLISEHTQTICVTTSRLVSVRASENCAKKDPHELLPFFLRKDILEIGMYCFLQRIL